MPTQNLSIRRPPLPTGEFLLSRIVPWRLRQPFENYYRKRLFRRAMKVFLKNPAACIDPENEITSDLVRGWGNTGWAATPEFLSACIDHALRCPGPILECGSGLSTVVVAAIAGARRKSHWVLEHDSMWAQKVQRVLDRYNLQAVDLRNVPLRDYGEFSWYKTPRDMPSSFSLVICDGPPGATKGGRYGLVPIMRHRLAPGCVILLDDAVRQEERSISERWERDLHGVATIEGSRSPFIKLTVEETRGAACREDLSC